MGLLVLSASVATAAFVSTTGTGGSSVGADTLDPPTSVAAVRSGSDNNLTWTPTVDTYADGYDIYRSTTSGSGFTLLTSVTGQATAAYSDTVGSAANPTFESLSFDSFFDNEAFLTKPTGTAEGDLLLAVLGAINCNVTKPTISGWTKQVDLSNANVSLWVYERVATASEAASYTFPIGQSCWFTADLLRYSGVDQTTPTENWAALSGSATPVNSPGTTSTLNNSLILRMVSIDNSRVTGAPSGHTMRANYQALGGNSTASADLLQASAGSASALTWSVSANQPWWSVTTVLRPGSQPYYYRLRSTASSWESIDSNEASG